ncbi:MAG: hypothetical protein SF162_10540 [bacterium]|nr:hypothetical protein [bacterium]
MPFIVIFIFGAVMIGAGAMLAPAWVTHQPRIGLTGALALALVTGGAVFWAMAFGWDTLVIDYLLFALVTSIFLFGTLSFGQKRAEARGEELADKDQGWPGPRDLLLFGLAALIFIVPALVLPVPLDTDAQGFGYLGLMAREGGNFSTLAPFHPEITYLYAPGFTALIAYLSEQLDQGLHVIQISVGAVLCILICLLAFDFGAEFGQHGRDKRRGRAMLVCTLFGGGLFLTFMDSHFTTLLAMAFAFAFLIFMLRYLRLGTPADLVAAGLLLGATVLSHPDTTIILGLGYGPFLITVWFSRERPPFTRWLTLVIGVPLIALLGIAPWLLNIRDLLGSDIASPFTRDPSHWQIMLIYHLPVVPFALIGAFVGLRRRDSTAILAVGWLILALDFSTTGVIERLLPGVFSIIEKYDYPFSIAWHAPIIPYAILGGIGLLWLWDRLVEPRFGAALHRAAPFALTGAAALAILLGIGHESVIAASKGAIQFYGAFSSADDVTAMTWIKANTPEDARILNHPAPHEADWAAVISERDAVYFRPQPFFTGTAAVEAEQAALRAFWQNPADPAHEALLRAAGIDYVLVPQVIGSPDSFATMIRWRRPFTDEFPMESSVEDAPYLELIFDADGARVYQLVEN